MPTTDRRPRPEPRHHPDGGDVVVLERSAAPRLRADYYDPDASTFVDLEPSGERDLLVPAASGIPSPDLLGVSRS